MLAVQVELPVDGDEDGDASELLERARALADRLDARLDEHVVRALLKLLIQVAADALDAQVEQRLVQRVGEQVEDLEGREVLVARVDVEAASEVVADGVLGDVQLGLRAAGVQLTQPDQVRVAAGAHHHLQQLVEVAHEASIENLRVEDDDELLEVLAQHELRVESVDKEEAEDVLGEGEQRLEARLVVRGVVEPAAERAEEQRHRVVVKRVDHVGVGAVPTQHADARFHLLGGGAEEVGRHGAHDAHQVVEGRDDVGRHHQVGVGAALQQHFHQRAHVGEQRAEVCRPNAELVADVEQRPPTVVGQQGVQGALALLVHLVGVAAARHQDADGRRDVAHILVTVARRRAPEELEQLVE